MISVRIGAPWVGGVGWETIMLGEEHLPELKKLQENSNITEGSDLYDIVYMAASGSPDIEGEKYYIFGGVE